jgi:arginine N-succinyltransferase
LTATPPQAPSPLVVVRPARDDDLGELLGLAASLEGTLTSLPNDAGNLTARIETSLRSFDPRVRTPGPEYYLFVLEDTATGRVLGTSAVMARVGGFDPSYTYEVRRERYAHEPLGIDRQMEVLHLRREHKGPSEIGGLALHPDARARGLGRLASLSRFLFVAAHPHRFADRIIAELRGWLDDTGRSPFWEGVGRHFFDRDLATADMLSGIGNKAFIEDLVPRHPIYTALLPPAARDAVGRVHRDTEPARTLLAQEGFTYAEEVDIFDAGPVVRAQTAEIRTVREARRAAVARVVFGPPDVPVALVSNGALDFRACLCPVDEEGDGRVALWDRAARLLRVGEGDEVVVASARGEG